MSIEMSSVARPAAGRIPGRQAGFSLVELLVVIGIIALLMSLLIPSLGRARRQARSLKCLANERQIGVALHLYILDNRGAYPTHSFWSTCFGKRGTGNVYDVAGYSGYADEAVSEERPLNPYLKSPEIFECPSDNGDPYQPKIERCYDAYGTS